MSVVQSDFTLNKLILLYILREKGCIARSELSDFVLYHKYMDYFALDQYLMELEDSGLITSLLKTTESPTALPAAAMKP